MENKPKCLFCGRGDDAVPLVSLVYQGQSVWICTQHFPILIHEPEKLASKLPGIDPNAAAHEPH